MVVCGDCILVARFKSLFAEILSNFMESEFENFSNYLNNSSLFLCLYPWYVCGVITWEIVFVAI